MKEKVKICFFIVFAICVYFFSSCKQEENISSSIDSIKIIESIDDLLDSILVFDEKLEFRYNYFNQSNQILSIASFVEDFNYGIYLEFSSSGQLLTSGTFTSIDTSQSVTKYCNEVTIFSDGFETGLCESYEECFTSKKNGKWTYYHENGRIQMCGNFVNNLKSGEWKYYNLSEDLILSRNYSLGKAIGTDKFIGKNWFYAIPPE